MAVALESHDDDEPTLIQKLYHWTLVAPAIDEHVLGEFADEEA
jgi:hypothetical protein